MTKTSKRLRRIAIGGAGLMIVLLLWMYAETSFATWTAAHARPVFAAIQVPDPGGSVHEFLDLRTASGALLARGDLVQRATDTGIESRMLFHLANSVFEETVDYTLDDYAQAGAFALQRYHLVQRGPLFAEDVDAIITSSGMYVVATKSHADGHMRRYVGNAAFPPDAYKRMVVTIPKSLRGGEGETVHIVAFTPQPRTINLELARVGTEPMLLGRRGDTVSHVALEPAPGTSVEFRTKLTGEFPPDQQVWIVTDQVPAFVRFQGPVYPGPVWRLDLARPGWAEPR